MTGGRLSLDRIARRWAAEIDRADNQASDIAGDLVNAALLGEFEFSMSPPPEPPENFDIRLGVLVETFTRDGTPVNAGMLENYLKARRNAPRAPVEEARQVLARDIDLSDEGFQRWCDRPEFAKWAQSRGLSRPQFIDEQSAALPDTSLPQHRKKKTPRGGGRKKGSGSWAKQDRPLLDEMKRLVDDGEVASAWSAANTVAGRAKGSGAPESKAKRLHKRYKKQFTGAQPDGGDRAN